MGIESVKNDTASYQRTPETAEIKIENTPGTAAAQRSTADVGKKLAAYDAMMKKRSGENEDAPVSQEAANEKIKKVVEEINKKNGNAEAIFGFHDGTNRVTIKIVDKETKEVLKEYPPEKTLDMIAKVWEMAGIMVDEKR